MKRGKFELFDKFVKEVLRAQFQSCFTFANQRPSRALLSSSLISQRSLVTIDGSMSPGAKN